MTYKPIREFIPMQCGKSDKRAKCLEHTYPHQHYILFCLDTPFYTVVNHESSMFERPILDIQDHEICISPQSSGSCKQYPTNKTQFSFQIGIEFGVQTHPIHANLVFLILFEFHYCVRPRVEGFCKERVSSQVFLHWVLDDVSSVCTCYQGKVCVRVYTYFILRSCHQLLVLFQV